ncbi:right-handed parallel beta-helix repeat-containing protein [Haladaptatus pallidirubidus]|uniref:Right handed beta helix domain-containing protein n=1 Tax=Haladaptatus pallidirubidus TaxID=1008152 RepID=A0AAV3UGN2_9EURY|nr:right-handed parallel beta-helix repeat-containing protein [Haladaptatus pallidirubidus]
MTADNGKDKTDEQNENLSADMGISRRMLLGALGVGSLLTASMPASAQEVESESDLWTQFYSGQLTERPDAGVDGRYYHAYDTGDLFLDDGDSWSLIDFGVNSIYTDELNNVQHADPEDDCPGIQAAIDALPSSGGKVVLEEGVYEVLDGTAGDPAIYLNKDNITLEGQGKSTVIYLPDGITDSDKGKAIIDIGKKAIMDNPNVVHGCHLTNFMVDGNMQNQSPDQISDLSDMHNIEAIGTDHKFSNLWSFNATGDGLELTSKQDPSVTHNIEVVNCHFQDSNEHNIHIHGAQNVTISNCILDGERQATNISTFTNKTDIRDITIDGCQIINGSHRGIEIRADQDQTVDGTQFRSRRFSVSDCLIADNGGAGVFIDGRFSEDVSVKDCAIVGNGVADGESNVIINGASVVEFANCSVKKGYNSGIELRTNFDSLTDVYLHDNLIKNNNQRDGNFHSGVFIPIDGKSLKRLRLCDNNIVSASDSPKHQRGVFVTESTAGTYTDVEIRGNYIKGVGGEEWYDAHLVADYIYDNTPESPVDVRGLKAEAGNEAYHDGTNSNTVGPAFYDGSASAWVSLVDGTTIS